MIHFAISFLKGSNIYIGEGDATADSNYVGDQNMQHQVRPMQY